MSEKLSVARNATNEMSKEVDCRNKDSMFLWFIHIGSGRCLLGH